MCSLPNMSKSDLTETSRYRKKKQKNKVKTVERVVLKWSCDDNPQNVVLLPRSDEMETKQQ